MSRGWLTALLGAALIAGGAWLAAYIQTSDGVSVREVRFHGTGGVVMSGLLYTPTNATPRTPAPGVLSVHGYINSRETQDGFAIEFARRGMVVLAMDQTGHGYSGGEAFSNGFGGPAGLAYLRSLPMVDRSRIGLEGHSMGGWTVLAAAAETPDDYRAMVLEGSSTGKPYARDGDPTWPRNLALVFSRYDEFSKIMWGVDRAMDIGESAKLQAVFGSHGPVKPGRIYGSINKGTARRLATPTTTHPGDHISTEAIGEALDWFDVTLTPPRPKPVADQIWIWKEVGTGVALIGFIAFLLGVFDVGLSLPAFRDLAQKGRPALSQRGRGWGVWLTITSAIPALTLFPAFIFVTLLVKPSWLFPQIVTNQIMVWALLNAALIAAYGAFSKARIAGRDAREIALPALGLAILTTAAGYAALFAADAIFKVDFRFWVVAVKFPSLNQALITLRYLAPLALFYLIALSALHQRLSAAGDGPIRQYGFSIVALSGGFIALLGLDYGAFFLTGSLPTAIDPLTTVIAIQFIPLTTAVAIVSTFTWRRTNSALPGALLNALLVTLYAVAGTATHVL